MKVLISILIGLLVVGCGKEKAVNTDDGKSTKAKPIKELTAEEKMVGEYEREDEFGDTYKYIFLENGVVEEYENGKEGDRQHGSLLHPPLKWGINKKGELYIIYEINGDSWIYSINEDRSITYIAHRMLGVRKDWAKDNQVTFKKIKHNAAKAVKVLKKEDVVGTYELNVDGDTYKQVFLKNGASGSDYGDGLVEKDHLWTIVKGEIIEKSDSTGWVWIKNKDGSVTNIADIDPEGKRKDLPKKSNHLRTYKKIE